MAFGDSYGYRTNSRFVAAVAESAERTHPNPAAGPEEGTTGVDADGVPVELTVVDLVLLGFDSGRRNNVVVSDETVWADIPVNQAVPAAAAEALTGADSVAPGETTGA